ncbi:MAG: hypothetical protein ACHP9Z_02420 [Streptosporangiales bacterium]
MSIAALAVWLMTAGGGLYLLTIWLIEFDHEFQSAAATRLPVPVISAHAVLAMSGLAVWAAYLITDKPGLAWTAALLLAFVAALGITLAARWIGVYRGTAIPQAASGPRAALAGGRVATADLPVQLAAPPERHFPLPVVIGHGILAVATIILVLLTALGGGGH